MPPRIPPDTADAQPPASRPTEIALSDLTASIAGLFALIAVLGVAMLIALMPRTRAIRQRLEQASARDEAPQTFELQGRRIDVHFGTADQGAPLMLSTPIARQPSLQIRPLTSLDRFGRRCGLARIASSGDSEFDQRALIDCNYRDLASVILRDAPIRAAVLALLDAGAQQLNLSGNQLSARFRAGDDNTLAQLRDRAELLAGLAQQLPAFVGSLTPMTPLWPVRRLSLLVGCGVLPVAALITCAFGLRSFPPLDLQALVVDALRRAPLWWLAMLVPALFWLRGHPLSSRLLPPTLLAATLAAPVAAIATDLLRNGRDAEAARETVVAVTGSVMLSGVDTPKRRWSSTALQQRGLFGTPHALSVEVGEAQWHDTPLTRARLQVRIAPGALGHPWLLSATTASAAEDGESDVAAAPAEPATTVVDTQGTQLRLASTLLPADESGAALLEQARALYSDGELATARAQLDRALLKLERENASAAARADAHWYRATIYSSLGTPFEPQQEADARAALDLVPGHTGAALLLDDVLLRHRRYADALTLWEGVLAVQPDYRYGHYKRAQLLATLGNIAEARREAQETCKLGERAACELADSF